MHRYGLSFPYLQVPGMEGIVVIFPIPLSETIVICQYPRIENAFDLLKVINRNVSDIHARPKLNDVKEYNILKPNVVLQHIVEATRYLLAWMDHRTRSLS